MGALLSAIRLYAPEILLSVAFESPKPDFLRIDDVDYYGLGSHGFCDFDASVERCVRTVAPDVIHIHGTEKIAQKLPSWIFKIRSVVVSIQGIMQECGRNYLGGLAWEELKRFRNPIRHICRRPDVRQIAANWCNVRAAKEREICGKLRFFMGRTDFDRAWVKSVNRDAHYFHVDEVLRPQFYQGQTWLSNINNHVIYAGGAFAYPLKGGHWLVQALEIVKRHYPNTRLRVADSANCRSGHWLDFIKRGEYQRYIVNLARELKVLENIDFMPTLTAFQVRHELEIASVYCLSSMMENSPNSLCEAQMVGTPVVATNVGGVSSLITDADGRLVPPGDPQALANAIMELFECPLKTTLSMTTDAYCRAIQRHSPQKVVEQLMDVYLKVMGISAL